MLAQSGGGGDSAGEGLRLTGRSEPLHVKGLGSMLVYWGGRGRHS